MMRRRCRKTSYASVGQAETARLELVRAGTHDPGLEIYRCFRWPCRERKTFHLGHPGRWRSLDRLLRQRAPALLAAMDGRAVDAGPRP